MADVIANRVDYRLLHGQVMSKWVPILNISKIYIIDDETANDEWQKNVLRLTAGDKKVVFRTLARVLELWKEKRFGTGRVLVLFKDIETARAAYFGGYEFPELVVGQVPGAPDRKIAHVSINVSDHELDLLKELADAGVKVTFQLVPDETPADLAPIYRKLKADFAAGK